MKRFLRFRKTRTIAKDRLKILLISDRVSCSPKTMDFIKDDIAKVLSRYMKIDETQMEVEIRQMSEKEAGYGNSPVLYMNIPIIDLRAEQSACRTP